MAGLGHIRTAMLSHLALRKGRTLGGVERIGGIGRSGPARYRCGRKAAPHEMAWKLRCGQFGPRTLRAGRPMEGRWNNGEDDEHATVRRCGSEASRFSCGASR